MGKLMKGTQYFIGTLSFATLISYIISQGVICQAEPTKAEPIKESAYYEVKKDGRLYVFTSSKGKEDFEKSGEIGKGIVKIGYGPNGETVIFDSDEAIIEYESRIVRELIGKSTIKAYREFKIDGRLYVFTSPTRKLEFEKSGKLEKGIVKAGYGPHDETVIFDSDEAVKEYDKRHAKK